MQFAYFTTFRGSSVQFVRTNRSLVRLAQCSGVSSRISIHRRSSNISPKFVPPFVSIGQAGNCLRHIVLDLLDTMSFISVSFLRRNQY